MKRCPECRRDYYDETLLYCLDDGAALVDGPAKDSPPRSARRGSVSGDAQETAVLASDLLPSEVPTRPQVDPVTDEGAPLPEPSRPGSEYQRPWPRNVSIALALGLVVVAAMGVAAYLFYGRDESTQIQSIAVMPFLN